MQTEPGLYEFGFWEEEDHRDLAQSKIPGVASTLLYKDSNIYYKRFFKRLIVLAVLSLLLAFTALNPLPGVEASSSSIRDYSLQQEPPLYTRVYSLLVIPVEFSDKPHIRPVAALDALVFERMNLYFNEVSYGSVYFEGVVLDWIEAPKRLPYYGSDERGVDWRVPVLIRHAVNLASNLRKVDLDDYDLIMIVHSGPGQETSRRRTDIWSACWTRLDIQVGLTEVSSAVVLPEYEMYDVDLLGPYAHEVLHSLGLKDAGRNVGRWDVMGRAAYYGDPDGSSPAHLCAYNKIELGWIDPSDIRSVTDDDVTSIAPIAPRASTASPTIDGGTAISPIEEASEDAYMAVKIPLKAGRYYLVELRCRMGFDTHIPASGLLITLVEWRRDMEEWHVSFLQLDDGDLDNDRFIDEEQGLMIEGFQDPSNQTFVKVTWQ